MLRIALATFLFLGVPAAAQTTGTLGPAAPLLKSHVVVTGDVVRIGDFIENAGPAAHMPVFRAPNLGETGSIPAQRVLEAARAHHVLGIDTRGITEVNVTHASRGITAEALKARIAEAIARQNGTINAHNLQITFDRDPRTFLVEATAAAELQVARLSYDSRSGHFDIQLELPGSAAARQLPLRFIGKAVETVEVVTLTRSLSRGEIVRRSDIVTERRLKNEVTGEHVRDVTAVIGLSTKQVMRAGQILRPTDLSKPEIVQRNETVTLIFEAPGILLTSSGKALEGGAEGEPITVLNPQSKRNVQGIVTAPGTVTVRSLKPRAVAALTPEAVSLAASPLSSSE